MRVFVCVRPRYNNSLTAHIAVNINRTHLHWCVNKWLGLSSVRPWPCSEIGYNPATVGQRIDDSNVGGAWVGSPGCWASEKPRRWINIASDLPSYLWVSCGSRDLTLQQPMQKESIFAARGTQRCNTFEAGRGFNLKDEPVFQCVGVKTRPIFAVLISCGTKQRLGGIVSRLSMCLVLWRCIWPVGHCSLAIDPTKHSAVVEQWTVHCVASWGCCDIVVLIQC